MSLMPASLAPQEAQTSQLQAALAALLAGRGFRDPFRQAEASVSILDVDALHTKQGSRHRILRIQYRTPCAFLIY